MQNLNRFSPCSEHCKSSAVIVFVRRLRATVAPSWSKTPHDKTPSAPSTHDPVLSQAVPSSRPIHLFYPVVLLHLADKRRETQGTLM